MKEYFEKNCINISAYARNNGLEISTLSRVINGEIKGKSKREGNTKKVFEALFRDGIIKELPEVYREQKA